MTDPAGAGPDPRDIVRRGYDTISDAYRPDTVEDVTAYHGWLRRYLLSRLGLGATVLDLGCGNGVPTSQILAERYEVIGVDFSAVQIERARRLVPQAMFLCADMTQLSFDRGRFDAIVAMFSIIHVPVTEQPRLFRRIADWLRPGGLFLATLGHHAETNVGEFHGAPMYWSHTDGATYVRWLDDVGITIEATEHVPEEPHRGHQLVFGVRRSHRTLSASRAAVGELTTDGPLSDNPGPAS